LTEGAAPAASFHCGEKHPDGVKNRQPKTSGSRQIYFFYLVYLIRRPAAFIHT